MGNLANLETLSLGNNQLSGPIPTELGNLTNLRVLILYGNQLSGTIPTELGDFPNLIWLMLGNNQLSGTIPEELGNLANLRVLALYGNQLSGTIPAWLSNLTNLKSLSLDHNQLSGTIPAWLGNFTNLNRLRLAGNDFTGCVPKALASVDDSDLAKLGLPVCPNDDVDADELDRLEARIEVLERAVHTHGADDGSSVAPHVHVRTSARIDSVAIRVAESSPPQYFVDVVSVQSDACVHFAGYDMERDDARITIKVWNEQMSQPDIACATVVNKTETGIPLGSDFQPGTTYEVAVNGETHTFTGQ